MMSHGKQMLPAFVLSLLSPLLMASPAGTDQLCKWRTELERIYHDARLPPKRPFNEEFTPPVIEKLIATDLRKENLLNTLYGVSVTQEMLNDEIQRIERDTQDAATLARIKTTLGSDGIAFAESVVRPIIVERLLRLKFYQDKVIHAKEREKAISIRLSMEAGNQTEGKEEHTWLLAERPAELSAPATNIPPSTANSSAPSYTNQATAQLAQVVDAGGRDAKDSKEYFSDLDPELAAVLKKHLQLPGDVSPIIESTSGFSIYKAREMTTEDWKVDFVFIPRIGYDAWLASQASPK
jgi:hypothetical protein